jgi:tetratricopeptide (TPR) repeat protein
LIYKATSLLDRKNDIAGAETTLRQAIQLALDLADYVQLIEAKTFLGEVLTQLGREKEALREFGDVLEIDQTVQIERDLVEPHLRTAREYVAKASGLE